LGQAVHNAALALGAYVLPVQDTHELACGSAAAKPGAHAMQAVLFPPLAKYPALHK